MKSNILNKILFAFIFIFLINGVFAIPSEDIIGIGPEVLPEEIIIPVITDIGYSEIINIYNAKNYEFKIALASEIRSGSANINFTDSTTGISYISDLKHIGELTYVVTGLDTTMLLDGRVTLEITVTDDSGNTSLVESRNLVKDTVAPVLKIRETEIITKENTITILGNVDDLRAITTFKIEDTTILGNCASLSGDVSDISIDPRYNVRCFISLADLKNGKYNLLIEATDVYSNKTSVKLSLISDTSSPVVTVDDLSTRDTTPVITGTVSDLTLENLSVKINSVIYDVTDINGIWSVTVIDALPIGTQTVVVVAKDKVGYETTQTFSNVIIEATPTGGGGRRITPADIPQPIVTVTTEVIPRPEPFIAPENNPATPANNASTGTPVTGPPAAEELAPAATETPTTSGATGFLGLPGNTARNVGVGVGVLAVIGAVGYFFFLRPR